MTRKCPIDTWWVDELEPRQSSFEPGDYCVMLYSLSEIISAFLWCVFLSLMKGRESGTPTVNDLDLIYAVAQIYIAYTCISHCTLNISVWMRCSLVFLLLLLLLFILLLFLLLLLLILLHLLRQRMMYLCSYQLWWHVLWRSDLGLYSTWL